VPTETNVEKRLRAIGFESVGQRGIASTYTASDGGTISLAKSLHLALATQHKARIPNGDARGSVNLHRVSETESPEQRREAVLIANGPYEAFFRGLVRPSGYGSSGGSPPAWHRQALEDLLTALEQLWA